jgi:hypothetical protein
MGRKKEFGKNGRYIKMRKRKREGWNGVQPNIAHSN